LKFVDSFSDIESYSTPLGQTTSASLEMAFNQNLEVKKYALFDQVSVQTSDGFLKRNTEESYQL